MTIQDRRSSSTASRTNDIWLDELKSDFPTGDSALEDLRLLLIKGLTASFGVKKRVSSEDIQDFAQESEQKIIEKLDSFRGESKFTTWALKIAINHAISELRKKRWQDVSLDALDYPDALFDSRRTQKLFERPEKRSMKREIIEMLNRVMREELTEKQRRVVTARFLYAIPPSHIAREMKTTRGAVYKLLHDSRKRLKEALEARDFDAGDLVDLFD